MSVIATSDSVSLLAWARPPKLNATMDKLPKVDNLAIVLNGDPPMRCATKTIRLASAGSALVFCCAPSAAGPAEDNVIGAFESYCLDNLNAPDRATRMIAAVGLAEVQEPHRAILMADHPGRAWASLAENQKYFIKLSDDGVCSIASPVADGNLVRQLFVRLSRNKLLTTETVGSETQSIFAVTHPDPRGADDGHAIVMVASSDLPSVGGAALTSVPEKAAKSAGINVPLVWP
jgi:hypothetical protein